MTTKESVLSLLEQNRGIPVSGEAAAEQLDISRNAVWKAVQSLREQGYPISGGAGRGYALSPDCDILSAEGIRACGEGKLDALAIHVYPSLESTNKTAKALALDGAPHGTAVIADAQTAGRGRYGRGFASPAGVGLYMSVILQPSALVQTDPACVTIGAALSVCHALEALTGHTPQIKWVNDILLGRKKICGILTEGITDYESGSVGWVVLGIGINVSTRQNDFPPELQELVTSLYPDGKPKVTRNRLAAGILSNVLSPRSWDETVAAYKTRLAMLGESVTVTRNDDCYPAIAEDVTADGRLVVLREDGERETLSSGEIRISLSPNKK